MIPAECRRPQSKIKGLSLPSLASSVSTDELGLCKDDDVETLSPKSSIDVATLVLVVPNENYSLVVWVGVEIDSMY